MRRIKTVVESKPVKVSEPIPDQKIRKYQNINIGIIPIPYGEMLKKYLITNDDVLVLNNFTKLRSIDEIDDIANNFFFLFFESDDEYLYHLDKIVKNGGKLIIYPDSRKYNYVHSSKKCRLTLEKTLKRINDISHYDEIIHGNICQALEQTKNLEGAYVEIGVYKGGSALTALNYMTYSNILRKSYFLDTYNGFNYTEADTSCDIFWNKSHKLYGPDETINKINTMLKEECPSNDFKLIKSNICSDDLPTEIDKIAVANIDVDMLEATLAAFEKVGNKIVDGGIIIAEDPTSTPGLIGAFYAMEQFLLTDTGKKFMKLHLTGQYFLIKIRG